MLATPPADCLRGLLVGRSLVEFALRYCQVLIELAKPRQIAGGQLHPRRGMTAGPEEEIALLMRRWEQVKAGDGAVVLIGGEPGNREIAPPDLRLHLQGRPTGRAVMALPHAPSQTPPPAPIETFARYHQGSRVARRSTPSSTGQANRPSSYGVTSRAITNAAARADRDLRKIPSRIASPSTNGPSMSRPEPRAATGRVTSSFVSAHGQCSFSMSANRA